MPPATPRVSGPLAASRQPGWIPYAPVHDLDRATERATSLGAHVFRQRTELLAGTLVVLNDPTGATFTVWQARNG